MALYPEMIETPSADVIQRTEWNIRDSTCCIVFNTHASDMSPGTSAGYTFNEKYGVPHFDIWLDGPDSIDQQIDCARDWLRALDDDAIVLGIGGPRASEYPGIYEISYSATQSILAELR